MSDPSTTASVWRTVKNTGEFKSAREIVSASIHSVSLRDKWQKAWPKSDTLILIETLRNRWSGTSDIKYIRRRAKFVHRVNICAQKRRIKPIRMQKGSPMPTTTTTTTTDAKMMRTNGG